MIKPTFTPCGEIFYITARLHVWDYIAMYQPLQVSKCEKCGKVIAEPRNSEILEGTSTYSTKALLWVNMELGFSHDPRTPKLLSIGFLH